MNFLPQALFWPSGSAAARTFAKARSAQAAMSLAAQFASFANRSDDLQALQQEACRIAAKGLDVSFSRLLVYDAGHGDFLIEAGVGWRLDGVGRARSAVDVGSPAGFAWHTGEPVVSDAAGSRVFPGDAALTEHGITRSIDVPVPGIGALPFGVLQVAAAYDEDLGIDDAGFLQLIVHVLASARERMGQAACRQLSVERTDAHRASMQELHHRVRNDLQGIASSIERESRLLDDTDQQGGYGRVGRRVVALAGLYDHLLVAATGESVEMGGYLSALCPRIAEAGDFPRLNIALDVRTEHLELPTGRAGQLAVALNELIANAAEHAFPDGQPGTITVRLATVTADGRGCSTLTVSDDGRGFMDVPPGRSGLGFVHRLVRGAGGVLTRLDGAGTGWQIALPS